MTNTGLDGILSIDQTVLASFGTSGKPGSSFTSAIRGWKVNTYILLDRPASTVIQGGRECVIRLLRDGCVYGFRAWVLDGGLTRPPQFRIAWPDNLQSVGLRKHDRLTVTGSCSVQLPCGDVLDGELHDVSEGGCGVLVDEEIPKGVGVSLCISLASGVVLDDLRAIARNCLCKGSRHFVGFAFDGLNDDARRALDALVTTTILGQREVSSRAARVLIYHGDCEEARTLGNVVEGAADAEVRIVSSVVDAFHELRALPASALVLPLACKESSAVELCRMVFGAPGLKNLPVYVLGDPGSSEAATLRELGVRDVIRECKPLGDMLVNALGIASKQG